jgi:hypothetical protein
MTNDLAATVAALRDGDRVRATFVFGDALVTVESLVRVGRHYVCMDDFDLNMSGPNTALTAVEVLAPALPPEPPVGSGVFHDGRLWVRGNGLMSACWHAIGATHWLSWAEVQPCVPAVPLSRNEIEPLAEWERDLLDAGGGQGGAA